MSRESITNFAGQYRKAHDYLYLLVDGQAECAPVSYTHLTLPTNREV